MTAAGQNGAVVMIRRSSHSRDKSQTHEIGNIATIVSLQHDGSPLQYLLKEPSNGIVKILDKRRFYILSRKG